MATPARELTLTGPTTSDRWSCELDELSGKIRSMTKWAWWSPNTGTGISTGLRLEPLGTAAARLIMVLSLSLRWTAFKFTETHKIIQLVYFPCPPGWSSQCQRLGGSSQGQDRLLPNPPQLQPAHPYTMVLWTSAVSLCFRFSFLLDLQ